MLSPPVPMEFCSFVVGVRGVGTGVMQTNIEEKGTVSKSSRQKKNQGCDNGEVLSTSSCSLSKKLTLELRPKRPGDHEAG